MDGGLAPLVGSVGADERVGVLIEGNTQQEHTALSVGFAVTASTGELMFWSLATDQSQDRWPRYDVGLNRLLAWLPLHFLNEGDYVVELMVSLHFIQWMSQPGKNAPQLRLSLRGGLSQSPFWMMAATRPQRPGLGVRQSSTRRQQRRKREEEWLAFGLTYPGTLGRAWWRAPSRCPKMAARRRSISIPFFCTSRPPPGHSIAA